MRHDYQVITAERFEQEREQTDDKWSDWDIFYEGRDEYHLRELVLEVVEGQFTHPSGHHSIETLTDSISGRIPDFSNSVLPDSIPGSVREKFEKRVSETVSEHAEDLYNAAIQDGIDEELDEMSLGELQSYLEQRAEELGIPETK